MEITLSRFAGFCGGVRRAYGMIMDLDMSTVRQPVFILGSLVHNDDVVARIKEKGIRKISPEEFANGGCPAIGTLVISAHGVGPEIYALAKERGIDIIDTTCPRVSQVQKLSADFSRQGKAVFIVGDRDHKEVRGIFQWGESKGRIVSDETDLDGIGPDPESEAAVIAQTTQDIVFFEKAAAAISGKRPKAEIRNTICLATDNRQKEVMEMARANDAMIIIGSPESANSTRLYEISKRINPRTVFIERADGLDPAWLYGTKKLGVSAGASTPSWIIDEVMAKAGSES